MTISVGVATAGVDGSTAEELIRAADNAVYAAKEAGRDRIVVYNA
jgi:diguanylate cyclase (GGDEF)-like protein